MRRDAADTLALLPVPVPALVRRLPALSPLLQLRPLVRGPVLFPASRHELQAPDRPLHTGADGEEVVTIAV